MCIRNLMTLLCALYMTYSVCMAMPADFTVATHGSDLAKGSANAPFLTLERAQQAVRDLKRAEPQRRRPIVVHIRGGVYYLPRTLTFSAADSGTSTAPIIYEAPVGEEAVLSAGVPISTWQVTPQGHWQAQLTDVAPTNWVFSQLYVNGARRFRPTWPRQGYNFVEAASSTTLNQCPDRFVYRLGDIQAQWQGWHEKEVCLIHNWNLSRFNIKDIIPGSRTVVLAGQTWHASLNDITPRNWYRVENVREAFDQPGQWYLERSTGTLSYIPLPGEDPTTSTAIAPRHASVIAVKGELDQGTWAEHLIFRRLTLAHNNWNLPTNGYSYAQAEAPIIGAFTARFARHIRLEECLIKHTGTYGVDFGNGCTHCSVTTSELFDLGAGGVKIGIAWEGESDPRNYAYNCTVRDNLIVHGGRVHPAGVGIWLGHAATNKVEHNTIRDFYYSGISLGWKWVFGDNPAHHNTIAWNHISHIGQRVLSDMGGIYMLGEQPGTHVHHNVMYDITRARYGGWGIYFDSGSSHILVEDNLVYDTEDGGLIHGANSKNNIVRRNVLALGEKNQLTMNTSSEGTALRFEHNAIVWQKGNLYLHAPPPSIQASSNLYWYAATATESQAHQRLLARQLAQEQHSVNQDPGFQDLAQRNFDLKPNSPLAPFITSWSEAGITPRPLHTSKLKPPPVAYTAAPPELQLPLKQDFENLAVGQGLPAWHLHAANKPELVAVTDEVAATGRQALRIIDGLESYEPHFYNYAVRREGSVSFSFDLRLGPGAQPSCEMRDVDPWYASGPLISVDAEGHLRAAQGKVLLKLPFDTWVNLKLTTTLGADRNGLYEVAVRLPDQPEPKIFDNLPCAPGFKTLGWIGFCSNGRLGSSYEIDNLLLTP